MGRLAIRESDKYWRLDDLNEIYQKLTTNDLTRLLLAAGHCISDNVPCRYKSYLIDMVRQDARASLCYRLCPEHELARFISDRGIDTSEGRLPWAITGLKSATSKQVMLPLLSRADECRVFHRFLDLTPELRLLVYEFYHAAFPKELCEPTEPPLSRTCRLVRSECLPKFYSTQSFRLDTYFNDHPLIRPFYSRTSKYLDALGKNTISCMTTVVFRLRDRHQTLAEITVELNKSVAGFDVTFTTTSGIWKDKEQDFRRALKQCLYPALRRKSPDKKEIRFNKLLLYQMAWDVIKACR